jgi:adenylate kinase
MRDKYEIFHFSTGNLLRNEVKERSEIGCRVEDILGSGGLVGDDIVNEIVVKNLADVADGSVVVLDGYPRTENQARCLDGFGSGRYKDAIRVIELAVDAEEVVARISQRRVCAKCGNTYGPMDKVVVCSCGGELIKRKDDEEATVRSRLREYEEATLPLVCYYADRIVRIKGSGTPLEVAQRVDAQLRVLNVEEKRR